METLDKIHERKNKKTAINNSRTRTEKVKTQAEYTEANKQVSKSTSADKRKNVDLETIVEKAVRRGNIKRSCVKTKDARGKYGKPERPVKDEVKPITGIQEQRDTWVK
ncbi:unnamed protein product [Schistosoma mattheei]|uniref:Uncharacterized protein n=1 Tax=Schistosoma mattheei TaxID=31246 RepID=A0A183NEG0_9TREM|nr:unnamed protein product [Schistosoma mattheei]